MSINSIIFGMVMFLCGISIGTSIVNRNKVSTRVAEEAVKVAYYKGQEDFIIDIIDR